MYSCKALGTGSDNGDIVKVIGVDADPNPLSIDERDVIYFAFANLTDQRYYIKKVDGSPECDSVLDKDYGNTGGTFFSYNGGIMAGMAVDLNGNLWIIDSNRIVKIDLNENVSIMKTGFTKLMGLDSYQEELGRIAYAPTRE